MPAGEFTGAYGKMLKYNVMFEGEQSAVELNQKPDTPAPVVGATLEGEIKTDKWGRKFKKAQQGYSGSNGKSDPQTQAQIIRQNSLTNAVAFVLGKAQHMDKKEAIDYISGKKVVQVATFFARYSKGEETVVTVNEDKQSVAEQPQDEPPMTDEQAEEFIQQSNFE